MVCCIISPSKGNTYLWFPQLGYEHFEERWWCVLTCMCQLVWSFLIPPRLQRQTHHAFEVAERWTTFFLPIRRDNSHPLVKKIWILNPTLFDLDKRTLTLFFNSIFFEIAIQMKKRKRKKRKKKDIFKWPEIFYSVILDFFPEIFTTNRNQMGWIDCVLPELMSFHIESWGFDRLAERIEVLKPNPTRNKKQETKNKEAKAKAKNYKNENIASYSQRTLRFILLLLYRSM